MSRTFTLRSSGKPTRAFGDDPYTANVTNVKDDYKSMTADKRAKLGSIQDSVGMSGKKWYDEFTATQTEADAATKRNRQLAAAEDYRKFKKACEKLGGDLKRRARGEEPKTADFVFEAEFVRPLRDSRKKTVSASPVCGGDSKKYSTAITRVGCSGGNRAVSVASLVSPRVSSSY